MSFKNLGKTFKYVNEKGDTLVFEYDKGYLINKPNGVDSVQVGLSFAQGIGQVGSTVQSKVVKARPINISGIVVNADQEARKAALMSVVRPDIGGRLYADDYFLEVYVTSTPTIEARKNFPHFQFSLSAPYPYWQKANKVSKALFGVEKMFKFPWNISREYQFGRLMKTQFVNILNSGQMPVPFTATFTATNDVTNPKIINVQTGEVMIINKSMIPNERIVVEITHGLTHVVSSVDGDIRATLDLDSNLFRLGVGDNVLKPEAEAGIDDLEVYIEFSPEIAGVTV